jgi:hypothetical protein
VSVHAKNRCQATVALAVVLAVVAVAPRSVMAQARTGRSLFDGANTDPNFRQNLTFVFSAAEAYDDNLEAAGEPRPAVAGFFTAFVPELRFESRGDTVSFGATGGASLRYYNDLRELVVVNQSAGIGMSAKLGRRTGMYVNQAVSYSPSYLYGLFTPLDTPGLGGVIPPATDYASNPGQIHSIAFATTARLDQALSRRTTVTVHSDLRVTNYTGDEPGYYPFRAVEVGAKLATSVTRDLRLGVDYTYRRTLYSQLEQPTEQNLTLGIEYNLNRVLRVSKRTTLGFHVGPAGAWGLLGEDAGLSRYLVVGDAVVGQKFLRTWVARAGYYRGFTYVEGLPNPAFENATTADVGGTFNRRTEFLATVSYSAGEVAYLGSPTPFKTYTGDAKLRFALSHRVAAFAEVFHYYYNFDQNLPLPPGVARNLTRNGVRVGATLWAPIVRRR